jgi:hypothetical protein
MVTRLVRRPRTKPPLRLPQRAEYDGQPGRNIASLHTEQPSFVFRKFAAGGVGWQYGEHVEEWRQSFSKHLQSCIADYESNPDGERDAYPQRYALVSLVWKRLSDAGECEGRASDAVSKVWEMLALHGINMQKLSRLSKPGMDCYQLPFGLLMLVSDGSLYVTSAAREYAHGSFSDRLHYVVMGPCDSSPERNIK